MWATLRSCQVMTCLPLIALLVVHPVRQDLSVAGLRKGLAGERSGLFMEQIRIVKEMRERTHGQKPRYMVWENVCFDADTLVTCDTGYKRIEDVAVGNLVKTMSGRYMPVMKVFRTGNQKVIRLKVSGAEDLIVTPNHPFWAREKTYPKGKNREIGEPKWVRADELTSGHMIAYKADTPSLPDGFISECEAFALGRWLADGSVDIKKSTPRIFISCGLLKADETEAELRKLPWNIHKNQVHKTAVNFCFTSAEFYGLIKDAGRGAGNKSVPSFVFNLPIFLQKEVLRGYTSGDGYIRQRGNNTEYSASTASRKLAYGIARLIRNVYRVAANISVRELKDGLIGCRVLHANYPSYNITASLSNKATTGYDDGEFIWQCVKSIEPEEEKRTVFNLSVYGDNTYGANDVVVHNCGAFSSNGGKDFQAVLTEIVRIAEPESPDVPLPEKGKWTKSGCLYHEMGKWSVAWRVHDAQFWGVPQRRKRIALVADFGGLSAPEICFVRKGMSRNPEPRKSQREETAGTAGESTQSAGCIGIDHVMLSGGTTYQGRGYYEDVSGCLKTQPHGVCSAISFQERAGKPGGGKGILIQNEHTGALSTLNNQSVFCLQGNGIDRADTAGCNGKGWCEDTSYTLNTIDRPAVYSVSHDIRSAKLTEDEITDPLTATDYKDPPAVAYGLNRERCGAVVGEEVMPTLQAAAGESGNNKPMVYSFDALASNSMKSKNPNSGCREVDVAKTLDCSGPDPAKNQGGIAIVQIGADMYNHKLTGDVAATLNASSCESPTHSGPSVLCLNDQGGSVMNHSVDVTGALRAEEHGHQPIVMEPVEPICVEMTSTKNTVIENGISPTLTARMGTGGNQVNALCMDVGFFQTNEEKVGALLARQYKDPPITYQEKTGSLLASGYEKNGTQEAANDMYITGNMVRRLTPLECERLQGFPDGWTDIGEWTDSKGKKHKPSDSPRYKALGNSIALPFWFYLLRRIAAQYERPATLGSLFDGISGFCLCWERCNGRGTALWTSEIEEFPIAVAKKHFGDEDAGIEGDIGKYL